MSIRGKAFIAGAFEHPGRKLPDRSVGQTYADVALGALAYTGLALRDVDGLFCDVSVGSFSTATVSEYLGIRPHYLDSTETGGSAYLGHVGHAAAAIAAGKCSVALVLLAGKPGAAVWTESRESPDAPFEAPYGKTIPAEYALAARRHMYEYRTTSEQLAEIKVAAAHHAQHNPNALLRDPVTVEDVLASPMIADPLHRLDCCVITDGGGGLVVVSPEVARDLDRSSVKILGDGESTKTAIGGRNDLSFTGAVWSGPAAFEEAGVKPDDIDYVSIYGSFTITVLEALEDLGFCEKGHGGRFVVDGALQAPDGRLPFNTDGDGLCNNHPVNQGGMIKVIEAVRQLLGEANPEVQVRDCRLALAHGNGGSLGTRSAATTLILGQEDSRATCPHGRLG